jgi:hypothetical protein
MSTVHLARCNESGAFFWNGSSNWQRKHLVKPYFNQAWNQNDKEVVGKDTKGRRDCS